MQIVNTIVISLSLLFLLSQHVISKDFPTEKWQQYASVEDAGWSATKLNEAKQHFDSINSAALMVIYDGKVLINWGDNQRRYMCHAIRNNFISSLIGVYASRSKVDLNLTLEQLKVDDKLKLTAEEKKATIFDLLKSRSGVYHPSAYEAKGAEQNKPARGSHKAGTYWYYNNWDYNALCTIFEKGIKTEIFREFYTSIASPLQMQDFRSLDGYHHFDGRRSDHPAYPVRMSSRDLARFGLLYLNEGNWNGVQLISKKWVEDSHFPFSKEIGAYKAVFSGFGLHWWIGKDKMEKQGMYTAAGAGHYVSVFPKSDLVIVHRSDTYNAKGVNLKKYLKLCQLVVDAKVTDAKSNISSNELPEVPSKFSSIALSERSLNQYPNKYHFKWEVIEVVLEGKDLIFKSSNMGIYKLLPIGDDKFIAEDIEREIIFHRSEAGSISELELKLPNNQSIKALAGKKERK